MELNKQKKTLETDPPTPSCLSSGCQGHTALVKMSSLGNSKVVQGLGCQALTAEILGSIPGQGNKIQQAKLNGQEKKKKGAVFTQKSHRGSSSPQGVHAC